jgi:predicted phage terminase large subunit-like protein
MLLIEQKASGMSITQDLNRMGLTTRGYNPGRDDKFTRISKGATLIQQGRFYVMGSFPGSKSRYAPWVAEAIDQIVNFPSVEHDDYVDSLSQALIYLIDSGFVCEYPGRRVRSPDMMDADERGGGSTRGNCYSI